MKNLTRLTLVLATASVGSVFTFTASAQTTPSVGIGTTAPDASAALDIVSSNKGALLPRVADATALANPATGLIVFQTGGTAGFYYNAGTPAAPSWQQLATVSGAVVTASNGLTKTGQDIRLGGTLTQATTINQSGNALSLTGGNVGIGTTSPSAGLHVVSNAQYNTGRFASGHPEGAWLHLQNTTTGGRDWSLISTGSGNSEMAGNFLLRDESLGVVRLMVNTSGNVGIGTTAPAARLHVAGTAGTPNVRLESLGGTGTRAVTADASGTLTTTTGGNLVSRLLGGQSGTATLGTSTTSDFAVYTVTFPTAFTAAPSQVICTVRTQDGQTYNDTFAATTKTITATTFQVNVKRVDNPSGWGQTLLLDWIAIP